MPQEQGYQRQVATGGPQRAVLTDADAYGAGIGRAIERGGAQLHDRQLRGYKIERQEAADTEAADVARRAAEARVRMDQRIRASRTGPVPGAKGHAEAVQKALEEERATLLDGISEDSIRRSAATNWDDYSARTFSAEDGYELGRRVDLDIANLGRARDLGDNRIRSHGGDNAVYSEELTQGYAAIDALENVTPEEKDKLKVEHERTMTGAWLEARGDTDPAGVKLELASGLYDGLLSPEQVERLDRSADIEIKAQVVAAAAEAQEARKAARNDVEALEAQTEAGNLPAPKDAAAVLDRARKAGVPEADLIRMQTKLDDARVLRAYSAAQDPAGARSAATVAEIDALIRSGKATPEQYRLRDTLAGYAEKRATDAGKALKEAAQQGPAGQVAALDQISQLPSRAQRFAAAQALGDDLGLGFTALLPSPASRQLAVNGRAVLKARPKDFGEKIDVDEQFAQLIGPAASSLGGSYGGLKELAQQIYAGQMNEKGLTGWNKRNFALAVKVAFGATTRPGGTLQGGIGTVRGRPVLLPDDFTADEFDAKLSRLTFADAVYADGSAVNKVDVLSRFRPEWYDSDDTGASYYRLIGPGNKPLRMKDGSVFPIRVHR